MTWSAHSKRRLAALGVAALALVRPWPSPAAETTDPVAMGRTQIILKVDAQEPVPIEAHWRQRPPTIRIQFPARRVTGSLPQRSAIARGPVQTITAQYEGRGAKRFLRALDIRLSGPYTYRARSEAGRIVIEVDHPSSISSASLEIGLQRGTIIGSLSGPSISERFRAMQDALAQATPVPLRGLLAPPYGPVDLISGEAINWQAPIDAAPAPAPGAASPPAPSAGGALPVLFGMALVALAGWLAGSTVMKARSRRQSLLAGPRLPSGAVLIDQLVWRAFERQGYQLVLEKDLIQPPFGTFRVVIKDGVKSGLLFVWYGPFFEKQTVERFVDVMKGAKLPSGILVASGSFTVPAQRLAKQQQVALIGREQLTELLSVGAGSEYYARQLAQQQAKLEEAKATLRQYAEELETLRRQRNEASWYLGEERAKTAKLEAELNEAQQQLRRYEADLQRLEREAAELRKQWQQSEWYLGESRERFRFLETQVGELQDAAKRAETAERERDETSWYLGEERARSEAMERQLAELQQQVQQAGIREQALEATIERLRREIGQLQRQAAPAATAAQHAAAQSAAADSLAGPGSERRRAPRLAAGKIKLELRARRRAVFTGAPKDVSAAGAGVETTQALPVSGLRVRLLFPGRRPILSRAEVVWQRADEPASRFRSGWRFVGLSDASQKRLRGLLDTSGSPVGAEAGSR